MDHDLNFLGMCSKEDLSPLVNTLILTPKGELRKTETLTNKADYNKYQPEHNMYAPLISDEFIDFGSNSILNLIGKRNSYRDILIKVCKKIKVNFNEESAIQGKSI